MEIVCCRRFFLMIYNTFNRLCYPWGDSLNNR
ncbi:hypothetical protein NC651_005520 [Populus alba x Populus x berolinensis]|nr:hypothetical protein NC651_005520 [Populus alba x Populus x berolinensis]